MAKAVKFKNDYYLDSSAIVNNKVNLSEIMKYQINYFNSSGIAATTGNTNEIEFIHQTMQKSGTYIFCANIPLNYYGQNGRELYLRLKVNGIEVWYNMGVLNLYVYTMSVSLFCLCEIQKGDVVTLTIQDALGKTFACREFNLYYMCLN